MTLTKAEQDTQTTHTTFTHPKSGIAYPVMLVPCAECGTEVRINPTGILPQNLVRCVSCGSTHHINREAFEAQVAAANKRDRARYGRPLISGDLSDL